MLLKQTTDRLAFFIFSVWILLLPFSVFTKYYMGNMAIDKLLAPLLLGLWLILFATSRYSLSKAKVYLLCLAAAFFIARNLSFFADLSIGSDYFWADAVNFGYFCLPLLFVDTAARSKIALRLVSVNAMFGCISVFLVALGVISLPIQRLSASRVGIEALPKSIGLFVSYGDLAQYAAMLVLIAVFVPAVFANNKSTRRALRLFVSIIVVAGLIGAQSRSYFLSVVGSLSISAILLYQSKRVGIAKSLLVLVIAGLLGAILLPVTYGPIVDALTGMGGSEGVHTARGRLYLYDLAIDVIGRHSIFFGVDAAFYRTSPDFAQSIHNIWLSQMTRGGLVSVLLLMVLLYRVLSRAIRVAKVKEFRHVGIVTVGYMVAVLISTLFYPGDSNLFWTLLGIMSGIVYSVRPEKSKAPSHARPIDAHLRPL